MRFAWAAAFCICFSSTLFAKVDREKYKKLSNESIKQIEKVKPTITEKKVALEKLIEEVTKRRNRAIGIAYDKKRENDKLYKDAMDHEGKGHALQNVANRFYRLAGYHLEEGQWNNDKKFYNQAVRSAVKAANYYITARNYIEASQKEYHKANNLYKQFNNPQKDVK